MRAPQGGTGIQKEEKKIFRFLGLPWWIRTFHYGTHSGVTVPLLEPTAELVEFHCGFLDVHRMHPRSLNHSGVNVPLWNPWWS
jgi:hypothetical protein